MYTPKETSSGQEVALSGHNSVAKAVRLAVLMLALGLPNISLASLPIRETDYSAKVDKNTRMLDVILEKCDKGGMQLRTIVREKGATTLVNFTDEIEQGKINPKTASAFLTLATKYGGDVSVLRVILAKESISKEDNVVLVNQAKMVTTTFINIVEDYIHNLIELHEQTKDEETAKKIEKSLNMKAQLIGHLAYLEGMTQ